MYWVEIQNGKISGKGESPALVEGQIEVSKEIYDQLTRLPATFETDAEGNIISVTPAQEPEPQPAPLPTLEELHEQQLAQAEAIAGLFEMIMVQGGDI